MPTPPRTPPPTNPITALTSQEWAFGHWSNPITAALTVYVTGVLLHALGIDAGYVLLGGILFTLTFVAATLAQHTRVLGIAYSAALAAATTGWLVYAAGHPTFTIHSWDTTRHTLTILGVGAIPFTVVYAMLIHSRNEAHAAAEARQAYLIGQAKHWHDACTNAGIKNWYYRGANRTPGGRAVRMSIEPGGTTYRQALARIEQLEVALQATYRGAVRIEPGSTQAEAVILLNELNMLAETVPLPAPVGPASILQPRTIGVHEDRVPAKILYAYRSSLSIGQRDGGKTNYQNVHLAVLQPCVDVLLWVVDFKQGSVVKPWLAPYAAGQVQRPAIDWVGTTIGDLTAMLDALDGIANARAGRRTGDKINPDRDTPAIRLIIDEVADVLADMKNAQVAKKLVQVLRKHRSEGIDEDLMSQRGTMSFLGPHARDIASQVAIVHAFKLDNPAEVFNTLGVDRSRIGGIDPSQFEYSGTVLTVAPEARKAPTKVLRIESDTIPAIAAANAHHRPTLNAVDTAAAGSAYARRWQTDTTRSLLVDAAKIVGGTYRPAHATTPITVPSRAATQLRSQPPTSTQHHGEAQIIPLRASGAGTGTLTLDLTGGTPLIDQIAPRGLSTRSILHQQHGPEEGERRHQYAQGMVALRTMKWILAKTDNGMLPTRDIIDRMLARDADRWADLTPKRLAQLLAPMQVQPARLGAPFDYSARGYRLSEITQALQNVSTTAGATASDGSVESGMTGA